MLALTRCAALALALAVTGCAGSSDGVAVNGPPKDVGHGSVEEVSAALAEQGVPCEDSKASTVATSVRTEQGIECVLRPLGARVVIVHFYDVQGARDYEAEVREAGAEGVFADAWAVRTEDERAAETVAAALRHRATT